MIFLVWILKDGSVFCKIDLFPIPYKTQKNQTQQVLSVDSWWDEAKFSSRKIGATDKIQRFIPPRYIAKWSNFFIKIQDEKKLESPSPEDFFRGVPDFSGRKLGKGKGRKFPGPILGFTDLSSIKHFFFSRQIIATKPLTGKTPKGRASMGIPPQIPWSFRFRNYWIIYVICPLLREDQFDLVLVTTCDFPQM